MQLESLNLIDIELCSCPDDETIGSINQNSLMDDDMRVKAEIHEKMYYRPCIKFGRFKLKTIEEFLKEITPTIVLP